MAFTFPKWANQLGPKLLVAGGLAGTLALAGVTYYFTPKYTRVGYEPIQPVPFSHKVHVGQLGVDCRYCHNGVDQSWFSNIPAASTCMNCHSQILKDDPRLQLVRDSYQSGQPIPWVQVHKVPDYVYFNHSVHVNRGVSCVHCHGQVNEMEEVYHAKPLSMGFCLDCHRKPEDYIRPVDLVTQLDWKGQVNGKQLVHDWKVQPGESCSVCHR
ncbi:MAG: cytochrome c3 family protein [Verrucomicrobia bacterium]|nr:cytochrome c3 family protein [Verrucomicrobiota bacterium]